MKRQNIINSWLVNAITFQRNTVWYICNIMSTIAFGREKVTRTEVEKGLVTAKP